MAATGHPIIARAGDPAVAGADANPLIGVVVKCGSLSPAAKPAADLNRFAGNFSSALRTAASTFAGTVGRSSAADTGLPWMIFPRIACADPPV
jgi:hypothetical protein